MRRLAMAALVCALAANPHAAQAPIVDNGDSGDRFLVVPFDNPGHDAKIYWVGEAAAILLADNLNALSRVAYSREERLEAFEQLQVPPVATLSHASVIRLGELVGAAHVVIGSIALSETQLSVHAQDIRLDTGRLEREVVETGRVEDLFAIFDRLTARLIDKPQGSPTAPSDAGKRPTLQVFENYVKGLMATGPSTRVGYLQSALKLDPGFDRARLALWSVNQENGNPQAALLAATAVPETSVLYPRARFNAALSLIELKRFDDGFATLKTLAERAPSAPVMNNLGVIQTRRSASPQSGKPTYYFNEAVKRDSSDPDYYFNLGYAYWLEHDEQGAIYWLREAVRRRPADSQAHALLAAALSSAGSATEAARERALTAQLSTKPVDGSTRGLERLKLSLEGTRRRIDTAIAENSQRDQRELAAFHLERGRRLFEQGNDAEATAELRRSLYSSPYEAEAHLLLGRIYLRMGQTQAAIDAFKISLWSSESTAAHLALAQAYVQTNNEVGARAEAQRVLVLTPGSAEAKALLEKLHP
jgi:predicted Zn-dependent protease